MNRENHSASSASLENPLFPNGWLVTARWPFHLIAVFLLWFLLITPPAFLSALFTLDVGGIFAQSAEFPGNIHSIVSPFNGTGRYFPLYWFYYVFLYRAFGSDVTGYYIIQGIIFLVGSLVLTRLFKLATGTGPAVLFAVLVFFSSPNTENLYTIGKAEPLLYLFCALVLLLFYCGSTFSVARCFAIAILFTFGAWSKETAITMFSFCAAGMVIAHLLSRVKILGAASCAARLRYMHLAAALVLGYVVSRVPYFIFANDGGSKDKAYLTYSLTWGLIADNIGFYVTQQPDVLGFGVLASILVVLILRRVIWRPCGALDDSLTFNFIFVTGLLSMAWSYMAILFVFRWGMGYYSFIPAILFRFVAAYGLFVLFQTRAGSRSLRITSCVSVSLLCIYSAIYMWYVGSSQISYSQAYTSAIREYLTLSHEGDSLIFESFPFYAEQVGNTKGLINVVFHQNRRVYGIGDVVDPAVVTPAMRSLLNVSDESILANERNIPQKNDYVVAVTGDKLATWQVRGVAPWYSDGSVLQKDGAYDMKLLAERTLYSPGLFVNVWTHRPTLRSTYVGYKIYRVLSGPRFIWLGRYPDGWVGKRARLTLYPKYVTNAVVHMSTSKYNPNNRVVLFRDDVAVERAVLSEGKEHTFSLECNNKLAPTVFRFEIEKAFVPEKLHLSNDARELGALVRLEPFAHEREQE